MTEKRESLLFDKKYLEPDYYPLKGKTCKSCKHCFKLKNENTDPRGHKFYCDAIKSKRTQCGFKKIKCGDQACFWHREKEQ